MVNPADISANMEVIGADGVHIGRVHSVENGRIKLVNVDGGRGPHARHHHFVPIKLAALVDEHRLRLSSNGDVSMFFQEEETGDPIWARMGG
jgi:hypothetical protein